MALSDIQQMYIREYMLTGNHRRTCEALTAKGHAINVRTPRRWYAENKEYKEAFDEAFNGDLKGTLRIEADLLAGKALDTLDEVMEADKSITVKVQCPECGERFERTVRISNDAIREKAAVDILKTVGMMKEHKQVDVNNNMRIRFELLTGPDVSAFMAVLAGIRPNPHMLARLREIGLLGEDGRPTVKELPAGAGRGRIIEGELA